MKHQYILIIVSLAVAIFFASCKREDCEGDINDNKPPIAIAGPDQVITLPTDSISLDGSASNDPDGTISEWLWKRISGPASFQINNASMAITVAKSLDTGVYRFELIVKDDGGLSTKDTIQVIVISGIPTNQPPAANAGSDQTITLPTNTIALNGNASIDPDNNISSYLWTKISGPSSFIIANAIAVQTQVTNLVAGVYQFELKVIDAGGLFSKDTMKVTIITSCLPISRPIINVQLVPFGNLSEARWGMAVASAGNMILFAGGVSFSDNNTSKVDIYNLTTNTWSEADLCVPRFGIAAVASGNKIFFGGGEIGDGTWPVDSVDIYDVSTGIWTVEHLSTPGCFMAAATVGNKIFFAGGDGGFASYSRDSIVDIYDMDSQNWSTKSLSERRQNTVATTANEKIYFTGGTWSGVGLMDIYDNSTNAWSISSFVEPKNRHAGIAIANKIYWAGGYSTYGPSCLVEIKDLNSETSSIQYLFKPGSFADGATNAVIKNNKILFFRYEHLNVLNDRFDIYDISTNSWSIGLLPVSINGGASIISVNNTIYIAGGYINGVLSNQVWKLEF